MEIDCGRGLSDASDIAKSCFDRADNRNVKTRGAFILVIIN